MIDRRLKRLQARPEVERAAVADQDDPKAARNVKARRGDLVAVRHVHRDTYLNPPRVVEREDWTLGKVSTVDAEGRVTRYFDHQGRSVRMERPGLCRVLTKAQLAVHPDEVLKEAAVLHGAQFDDLDALRALVRRFCA